MQNLTKKKTSCYKIYAQILFVTTLHNYLGSLFGKKKTFGMDSFVFEAESSRWNLATDQLSRSQCIIIGSIVTWSEVYCHCSRARERRRELTLDFRPDIVARRDNPSSFLSKSICARDRDSACSMFIILIHISHKYFRENVFRNTES